MACSIWPTMSGSYQVRRRGLRRLGELEAVAMDQMWAWDRPASVREMVAALAPDRELAYTTVMTVMDHLHSKHMVTRSKVGRAYMYSPAVTRTAYTAGLIAAVVDDAHDRTQALVHFVGTLSPEERARIKAALDESDGTSRR
jgi:predicted transcriptional regulator